MSSEVLNWPRSPEHAPRVLRVIELNRIARMALEDQFPDLWVEGELADVTRPASGHVYFTLCDSDAPAQVRGVMYRSDAQRAKARLENGARVRMRGALTLYEPRGGFQLQARVALPAGAGDRALEVARIREKLTAEGLLDPARKRPLPVLPRVVGVVTSRDGAAIHDIIRVALARHEVHLILAHCFVQGPEAPASIARALRAIVRVPGVDVVIIARGGGASEDLSAYDDERVARAVAHCPVPTVSGVGHELDVTLTDLVADVRAATPSNAAEQAVPEAARLYAQLETLERSLARALDQRVGRERLQIERALRRLADPRRKIARPRQTISSLRSALERGMSRELAKAHRDLDRLRGRLAAQEPKARLTRDRQSLAELERRLIDAMRRRLTQSTRALEELARAQRAHAGAITARSRSMFGELAGKLHVLSPLGILARGYSIVLGPEGRAITDANEVHRGELIRAIVWKGTIEARVEGTTGEPAGAELPERAMKRADP